MCSYISRRSYGVCWQPPTAGRGTGGGGRGADRDNPGHPALDDRRGTGLFFFLVENADAGTVYRIRHPPGTKLVSPAALELGGLMLDAVSDGRGWVIRVQFTDREALSGLWDACESDGITFDLRRLFRHQPFRTLGIDDADRRPARRAARGLRERLLRRTTRDIARRTHRGGAGRGGSNRPGTARGEPLPSALA